MEKELQEIRKDIVEARNLVIKNDNLLKNLGSDLKMLGKKQEAFERRSFVASGAAYLGFAALATALALLGSRGWVAQAESRAQALEAQVKAANDAAALAKQELATARAASDAAYNAYLKLEQGSAEEREAAASAVAAVDKNAISRLEARALEDRGRTIVQAIAAEKYQSGKAAFRRSEWRATVTDLGKAIALWPDHPDADENAFYLGAAAIEVKDWQTAATALQRFVDKASGKANKEYAHLLLVTAYEQLGQRDRAAQVLERAISLFPVGELQPQLRRRLSGLRRADRAAAAPAVAPAGAAPSLQPAAR